MDEDRTMRCAATLRRCRGLLRGMARGPGPDADGREWRMQAEALEERSEALAAALRDARRWGRGGLPLELDSRLRRAEHAVRVSESQIRRIRMRGVASPHEAKEGRD